MNVPDIPLIDIAAWRTGTPGQRAALAARLDRAMRDSGFFLVEGHGIERELMNEIRTAARKFFALPLSAKRPYASTVGGRGWLATGVEANSYYGEAPDASKPDLKETFKIGREHRTGLPELDSVWFLPNVWPREVPELRDLTLDYTARVRALFTDLLEMCAVALGLAADYFVSRAADAPDSLNINRYPPITVTGPAAAGQFRVGPHTDWGTLTILDREIGYGGLQVLTLDGQWADAPHVPGAFTVNIADLLARWTGDRWRSTRHRVLPPPQAAPDEDLISLISFFEIDMDVVISPFDPPVGGGAHYPPVTGHDYISERAKAADVA
ncbi:isopenicillin N synthase family dioxygenase [Nocardia inohanensis]|uniref:isopenicillin N synthase family dioxygenase n=1 Tax=Nocardia inohanensis TaxID=209246 RepID=UPI000830DC23|nr:2-oxoglutarate and iron-dependent oxygenase domain-containing protein [Nocardia inohanensis]